MTKSIFHASLFFLFFRCTYLFFHFLFWPFFSLSLFSPFFFHPAFPGAGAGNRRNAVRADGSYRYNVIADTGWGGRREGGEPRRALSPAVLAAPAIYRFIFVVRARAFPLRLAGCLQSNENLLGGQIFFRRRSGSVRQRVPRLALPLRPPIPLPAVQRGSISSGAYLYAAASRYLARLRARARACVRDDESPVVGIRRGGEKNK